MSPKILFFGNERLATGVTTTAPVLQALVAAGYRVEAVVLAQKEAGKSRRNRDVEIAHVANQHQIPVVTPDNLIEYQPQAEAFEAVAGILVAYGKIVPQEIIEIFPGGIINLHPSLLPKHRGPTPIESVILRGEPETGVSLMQLAAKMDAGPVYAQAKIKLKGDETKQALADQLLSLGKDMLIKHLPAILDGSLKPQDQPEDKATYDKLISKDEAVLIWENPAKDLLRSIRAYSGWPRSRALIGTSEVVITEAHVRDDINGIPGTLWLSDKELGMHTAEGVLVIDKLIPPGKKEMPAHAFLSGYNPL
jgi:methionyl-tRNA formyltransferase